ncbi:transposase [Flavobacterium sp. K5-23]|uniref:transposase n=1 Tax=Flavobacterium sp. K5-23 TaxID=2746225 RepID=UPI002010AAB5|nr:transposase [Flavobacterium sp. K5-23]UQD56930.1 transposase [Flavobacterium sp. K5-23]
MPLFKNKFKTESNRLKNWDYSSEAIYFITLVTQNRECIFGNIDDDKMVLNNNGNIIETELLKSISIRERWFFHNWIIMPNHIHLLVEILETHDVETHDVETHDVETHCSASLQQSKFSKLSRKPNSISSFVAILKSVTTKQINSQHKDASRRDASRRDASRRDTSRRDALQCVSTEPQNKIWQSNYHDHIVRDYASFEKIYYYIKNNPKNWNQDSINPH